MGAENIDEGIALCRADVGGLQFDKLPPEVLEEGVPRLRKVLPEVTLLAAGGINETNAAHHAVTGVNALVTASLFSPKPIDIIVKIESIP